MLRRIASSILFVFLLFFLIKEANLYYKNRQKINEFLQGLYLKNEKTRTDTTLAVFRYVYNNIQIAERKRSGFLRSDAIYIIENGGICGDFARLFILILHELEIPARRINITDFDYPENSKIRKENLGHVSTEVMIKENKWLVFDTHQRVFFKNENGEFLGRESLHSLDAMKKYIVRDSRYNPDFVYSYRNSELFNWNKFFLLKFAEKILTAISGRKTVENIPTPYLFENTHLLMVFVFSVLILFEILVTVLIEYRLMRKKSH
ncbi:MAG: transglutaminase domain-containing protein [Candidatus Coatesbacteria bacterium]|nr:transglutaminase domain-containing protein [Candidatus Coatesbacteria bacterium]